MHFRSRLVALALAVSPALAAAEKLAVLEFDVQPGVKFDRIYFSDRVRQLASEANPQLFLMTRESTEELLKASGKTMAECQGACEVETGKLLQADYVVSGRVTKIGSRYIVTMRLHSTANGRMLAAKEATGKSLDELFEAFDAAANALLAPLAAGASPPPAPKPQVKAPEKPPVQAPQKPQPSSHPAPPAPVAAAPPPKDDGPTTLADLQLIKKVFVYVADNYFDSKRIDPNRMLKAALETLAARSNGALTVTADEIAAGGERLAVASVGSIWALAVRLHDLHAFVLKNVPPSNPIARGSLTEIAEVNAMLATLDPHSVVYTPAQYAELKAQTRGEFGGLGIVVQREDSAIVIKKVIPETTGAKAGLRAGDRITAIEGKPTAPMSLEEAVSLMRGKPGTTVTLTVAGRVVSVERALVKLNPVSVKQRLPGDVAWIRVGSFNANTLGDVEAALRELSPARGLVLDLRGNPGGLLEQALKVSDDFISEGTLLTTSGMNGKLSEPKPAHAGEAWESLPVVVLIDEASASAAELVAGALRARGRGLLVGRTSFGKGTIQVLYDIKDTALKLTIAQYLVGGDEAFGGAGYAPDVETLPEGKTITPPKDRTLPPVGKPIASLQYAPPADEESAPDAVVRFARDVLASPDAGPRREQLLQAAAAVAATKSGVLR